LFKYKIEIILYIMQEKEKDINNAKKELANLYLILKMGKRNEVNDIYFFIIIL